MKKNILSVVMGCLLFVGLTSMVNTSPVVEPYDCASECEWITDEFGISDGQCMSLCRTCTNEGQGEALDAVCYCKALDILGVLEDEGINFGQCVKILKDEL